MKDTSGKQIQECFTQSSRSILCLGILKRLDHRAHRENLGDLSVVSVGRLCDLCEKLFAFLEPARKFMENPD